MIHLDTNVAIALLNQNQPKIRAHFDAILSAKAPIAMSMLVYFELMYGAANSQKRAANEHKIALFISASRLQLLDFVDADATEAAKLRAHLKASGAPIGPYDLLIAAQARRAQATLITANTAELVCLGKQVDRKVNRVPGLTVVDWSI